MDVSCKCEAEQLVGNGDMRAKSSSLEATQDRRVVFIKESHVGGIGLVESDVERTRVKIQR